MKKKVKLKLNRETVRNLSQSHVNEARGGGGFTQELSICKLCWWSDDYCPSVMNC